MAQQAAPWYCTTFQVVRLKDEPRRLVRIERTPTSVVFEMSAPGRVFWVLVGLLVTSHPWARTAWEFLIRHWGG